MDADKHIAGEESLLDRDTYRRIKKMDRATLEELIQDIFERGRKKGLAEAGVIIAEDVNLPQMTTRSICVRLSRRFAPSEASVKREPRR